MKQISGFLWVILIFLIVISFQNGAANVPLHADEKEWIATSDSLEAFVSGQIDSPVWSEHYWTLTQPPLSRYIIGIGRLVGNFRISDLQLDETFHANNHLDKPGSIPEPGSSLLYWSRIPMVILAILSGVILLFIVQKGFGWLPAIIFVVLYINNEVLLKLLRRATGESPLLLMVLVSVIVGSFALHRWRSAQKLEKITPREYLQIFFWFYGIGVCAGLAGSAKLNGLVIIPAGVIICLFCVFFQPNKLKGSEKLAFLLLTSSGIVFAALAFIIWLNPFLYADPIRRIIQMFNFRAVEMQWQVNAYPAYLIEPTLFGHINIFLKRVFSSYATLRFASSWIINLFFATAALFYIFRDLYSREFQNQYRYSLLISAIVILGMLSIPSLFSPLDWDRYFFLPVVTSLILIAVGISGVFVWIGRFIARISTR